MKSHQIPSTRLQRSSARQTLIRILPSAAKPQPRVAKRMVHGASSRFGARWVARKRQQAGRTPDASRGWPAERYSRSELLLRGSWFFALPLAPGFLLQPQGFLLTRIIPSTAKRQPRFFQEKKKLKESGPVRLGRAGNYPGQGPAAQNRVGPLLPVAAGADA